MRKTLKKWHRFFGIGIAVYMLVMSFTGVVLLFKSDIFSWGIPALNPPANLPSKPEQAKAVQTLEILYKSDDIWLIKFPSVQLPAYKIYTHKNGNYLIHAHTLKKIEDPNNIIPITDFIFDLHHYLLAGDLGKQLTGILSLATFILLIVGVYIWWPWRKGWQLKNLRPNGKKASFYRISHASTAIIIALPLMTLTLTGAGMIYSKQARIFLTVVFGAEKSEQTAQAAHTNILTIADQISPESKVRFYYIENTQGIKRLRLKSPDEWHPNGRSVILFNTAKQTVTYSDASKMALGQRMANSLYPAHIGETNSFIWWSIVFITGVGTFYICFLALKAVHTKHKQSFKRND